jgi:hypothetical protein
VPVTNYGSTETVVKDVITIPNSAVDVAEVLTKIQLVLIGFLLSGKFIFP